MTFFTLKYKFYIFYLILSAALFLFLGGKYFIGGNEARKIEISGNEFKVEIADNPAEWQKGLSGRKNICGNCGMLFESSEKGKYSFWMKGMEFDLDMLWIDGDRIVYIAKNIPADSKDTLRPEVQADKVLEINAGLADKMGISIGDKIKF